MDEVLIAPGVGELVVLPGVIDSQEREVVPFGLVELGFLLVSESLLVLHTEEAGNPHNHSLPYTRTAELKLGTQQWFSK